MDKIKTIINTLISKIGDKPLHAICSALITIFAGQLSLIFGIFAGLLVGLAKESYDEYKFRVKSEGSGFDWADVKYDILGVIIGAIILIMF